MVSASAGAVVEQACGVMGVRGWPSGMMLSEELEEPSRKSTGLLRASGGGVGRRRIWAAPIAPSVVPVAGEAMGRRKSASAHKRTERKDRLPQGRRHLKSANTNNNRQIIKCGPRMQEPVLEHSQTPQHHVHATRRRGRTMLFDNVFDAVSNFLVEASILQTCPKRQQLAETHKSHSARRVPGTPSAHLHARVSEPVRYCAAPSSCTPRSAAPLVPHPPPSLAKHA